MPLVWVMVNEEVADIFEKMSRVLAFKGANRFRTLAYERAARSLRDLDEDLTDTVARAAQEAGALLAINTDAHSVGQHELIRYGVAQVRRGWVVARSVVNTWTWAQLSRWLAARRSRELKAARI